MSRGDEVKELSPPLTDAQLGELEAGDFVKISGRIVTARDEAYERVLETPEDELPFDLKGGVVYHCGPLAKREGGDWKIVAAGPTTSARLDQMQEEFVRKTGVKALVGKGGVGGEVASSLSSLGCVYLAFTGGAAALASESIGEVEDLIWEDLGVPEALWFLKVEGFGPLVVAVDTHGNDLYR